MSIIFSPSGSLNVAVDASELPEVSGATSVSSGAMVRCKNLRLTEMGKAITRDGSAKLNDTAIDTEVWWIEEQAGIRYTFSGTYIYRNEIVLYSGVTSAQWAAIKYNAFNDTQLNIFALNGTDRKRIQNDVVREWGIAAPTVAPMLGTGSGLGLVGRYNAKYTYVRKSGEVVVAESNPSPIGEVLQLNGGSLSADVEQPTDPQVTHIRLYRTLADGDLYYYDQDILTGVNYIYGKSQDWEVFELDTTAVSTNYTYGYAFSWETPEDAFTGDAYKFSTTDATHSTENVYIWESAYTLAGVLTISLSPTSITESEYSSNSHITAEVTATPLYAISTVTYEWTKLSGDAITIVSPTSASTAFNVDGMFYFETRTATFRCTASDESYSDSEDIVVSITNYFLF